jgi:hypothetical protein
VSRWLEAARAAPAPPVSADAPQKDRKDQKGGHRGAFGAFDPFGDACGETPCAPFPASPGAASCQPVAAGNRAERAAIEAERAARLGPPKPPDVYAAKVAAFATRPPAAPCSTCGRRAWARERGTMAWWCVPCAHAAPGWTFQDPDEEGMHDG